MLSPESTFFFEIRRYFSKIAGITTDTVFKLLRTIDALLSENFFEDWG